MAQTLTRLALAAAALVALASAALAQTDPTPAQEEQARQTAEALLKLARSGWPHHPPFKDEIAADSPNAAARLMWLNARAPKELLDAAGWMTGTRLTTPEHESAAHFTPERVRGLLAEHRAWIDALDTAVRLDRLDIHLICDPRAAPLPKDDPRAMLGFFRKAARVARADAIRLWEAGDHDAALRRASIAPRLAVQLNKWNCTVIGTLVSESLIGYAAETLEAFDKERPLRGLAADAREDFAAALRDLGDGDANRGRQAWRRYADSMAALAKREIGPDSVGFELEFRLAEWRGASATADELVAGLLKGKGADAATLSPEQRRRILLGAIDDAQRATPEALNAALAMIDPLRTRIDAAWGAENADSLLKAIGEEIDSEETKLLELVFGMPRQIRRSWANANAAVRRMNEVLSADPGHKADR